MNQTMQSLFRAVLRIIRPWSLLAGGLLYFLGIGIVRYLGEEINPSVAGIGLVMVMMFLLSAYFLQAYFDQVERPPFELRQRRSLPFSPEEDASAEEAQDAVEAEVPRGTYLLIAAVMLTIGAVMTVLLYAQNHLPPVAFLFLALSFVLILAYSIPPLRLADSGYGELVLSILVANLFPTLAFTLQVGSVHRLLAMLTFPMTLLYLATLLAGSLIHYAADLKNNRGTMMVRLGWQRGMSLHNIILALAYVILSITVIAGLPWRLAFPAFLSLPVAIFQIWQMNAIAGGKKPRWRLLLYTAVATVGLTAYFINLAVWTS
jgi:1,4-dihydroxy-2-naphthoate octaprenyltransferase